MAWLLQGVACGHQHAGARQTRGQLRTRQGGVRRPHEVGLAVVHVEAHLAQTRGHARALLADAERAACHQVRAAGERLKRSRLRDLRDAQVRLQLGQQLRGARPPDRVADSQARKPPRLGEAAEHQQLRVLLEQRQRRVGGMGVRELHQRLVQQHRHVLRQAQQQPPQLRHGHQLARRIIGARERDRPHARLARGRLQQGVHAGGCAHRLPVRTARHQRIERVGGPGRQQLLPRLHHRSRRRAQQLG